MKRKAKRNSIRFTKGVMLRGLEKGLYDIKTWNTLVWAKYFNINLAKYGNSDTK